MNRYDWLRTAHIFLGIAWVGAAIALAFVKRSLEKQAITPL